MKRLFCSTLSILAIFTICPSLAQEDESNGKREPSKFQQLYAAVQNGDVDTVKKLSDSSSRRVQLDLALAHQNRGQKRFYEGDIKGSIEDFDAYLDLRPDQVAYHWQRGLCYYYAKRYEDGKKQFEQHQTVNSQDVENAVWHFLCAVKTPGGSIEEARKNLIPITKDTRVPMQQVHALFAGTGTADQVLEAAAKQGDPKTSAIAKNAMLYAHLYIGLYYEAIGDEKNMKLHIEKAASDFKMEHYMGKTAQVHAQLRGITEK